MRRDLLRELHGQILSDHAHQQLKEFHKCGVEGSRDGGGTMGTNDVFYGNYNGRGVGVYLDIVKNGMRLGGTIYSAIDQGMTAVGADPLR